MDFFLVSFMYFTVNTVVGSNKISVTNIFVLEKYDVFH